MEVFLYTLIFITGIFFGSFFTLAVHRIPKKEDILIKHSYCPNCNHKLGFFDLFPVLSYIFLNGKCRYCKNKIRPRYLILEVLAGVAFLFLGWSIKVSIYDTNSLLSLAFLLTYISVLFIIAGIDKENIKIERNVLIFGFVIEILYIIYQYSLNIFNGYQYVMYLSIFGAVLFVLSLKNKTNKEYKIKVLLLYLYILIYSGIKIFVTTFIISTITALIYKLINKQKNLRFPLGFCLSLSNIFSIIISNVIINYIV